MGFIKNIKEEIAIIKERDPAIHSAMEVFLYPSFKVMVHYRLAHKLYNKKHYFWARLISQRAARKTGIEIKTGNGIRYTVPSSLCIERMDDLQTIRFRVGNVYKNCHISVKADGLELIKLKKPIVAPGEMEQVILKKQLLIDKGISKEIVIELAVE